MSLAHIATLYGVINIYTVHNSYSSAHNDLKKTPNAKSISVMHLVENNDIDVLFQGHWVK